MPPSTSESLDSQWRFLSPWLTGLRVEYKALDVDSDARDPPQRILKVSLRRLHLSNVTGSLRSKCQEAYEALALLAAVERVDYEAWRYCLTALCGLDLGELGEATFEEKIPVRFLLDLDLVEEEDGSCDLVRICGTAHRERPSDEYVATLKKIAAMDKWLKDGKAGRDIEIPVKVYFSALQERTMEKLENVAKAEKIIRQQWEAYYDSRGGEQPVESMMFRCTFVLEPMIADFHRYEITHEVVETMGKLLDDNVCFSQVKLDLHLIRHIGYDENRAREALWKLFPALFKGTRLSLDQANPRYRLRLQEEDCLQIGAIHLECDSAVIGVRDFERTCSALTVCQTTRNLSLCLAVSPTAHMTKKVWWKWVAYSLFSFRAREYSSIDALTLILNDKVIPADISEFATVAASEHPEEALFSSPRGQVEEREATLKPGARIRWQITKQGTPRLASKELAFPYAIPRVRTFSDDGTSEWINVVIPGLSWCQVRRACLQFPEHQASSAVSSNVTSLTLFVQRSVASNAESLQRLLAVVGRSLKHLTLGGPGLGVVDENAILRSCPNLSKLSVRGKQFDVELDFSYYRGLGMPVPSIRCSGLRVTTLANALSDNDSATTKCVYKLRVHKEGNWLLASRDSRLGALLKMLAVNETLELLEIDSSTQLPRFADFREHNLKPIRRTRNIAISGKLAFLSVLTSRQKSDEVDRKRSRGKERSVHARQHLDQYVLSRIFAFAGPSVLRQVFVRPVPQVDVRPRAMRNAYNFVWGLADGYSSSSSSEGNGWYFWPGSSGDYLTETDEE